jgi:hypothetical protein
MTKRIFLNWNEITSKVISTIQNNTQTFNGEYISFIIKYTNWAIYITWEWDELKIIEEQKSKPKFKVWDYVVHKDGDCFMKIDTLSKIKDTKVYRYNWILESKLRLPTEEEISLYFR